MIALTSFLNHAQVNNQSAYNFYPVQSYGRLANRNYKIVTDEVIPYLAQQLKQAVKQEDSHKTLVIIRSLGNLGHQEILNVLEPYLEGRLPTTDFQRLAMVTALDRFAINYPKTARSVLYKIYQNVGEAHEVRCAAVFQLMRTNPQAALLQRMAEQTNQEPSRHVRAAVKSALESAAQLTAPENAELAANAKAAANILSPKTSGLQYSRSHLRDYVAKNLEASYSQQVSFIGSKDDVIPQAIYIATEQNLGGFKKYSEYHAMVSSIDQLTNILDDQFDGSKLNHENQNSNGNGNNTNGKKNTNKNNNKYKIYKNAKNANSQEQSTSQQNWSAAKIAQLLDIQTDEAVKLEGQILVSMLNTKRFFAFDNQTLEKIPREFKLAAAAMKNGHQFNYTKLYNQESIT